MMDPVVSFPLHTKGLPTMSALLRIIMARHGVTQARTMKMTGVGGTVVRQLNTQVYSTVLIHVSHHSSQAITRLSHINDTLFQTMCYYFGL